MLVGGESIMGGDQEKLCKQGCCYAYLSWAFSIDEVSRDLESHPSLPGTRETPLQMEVFLINVNFPEEGNFYCFQRFSSAVSQKSLAQGNPHAQ